jgi:hypothetical protein
MSQLLLNSAGNIALDAAGNIRFGAASDPCCCVGCPPAWAATPHYVRITYYLRNCQYNNSDCTSYHGGSPSVYEAVGSLDGSSCESTMPVRLWGRLVPPNCDEIFGLSSLWRSDGVWSVAYSDGTWTVSTPTEFVITGDETGGCAVFVDIACTNFTSRRECMTIEVSTTPYTLTAKTTVPTIPTDCNPLP